MSFLKDVGKAHKERSQPGWRRRFGMLEKKKDYKLRAKDYRNKRNLIKKLTKKAAARNPDEFYFEMLNSSTDEGVHVKPRKPKNRSMEQLRAMKTKDMMYLINKRQTEKKKIERLESTLHCLGTTKGNGNKHTIFVDTHEEAKAFDPSEYFQTLPELLPRRFNRPTIEQLHSQDVVMGGNVKGAEASAAKARKRQYSELAQRVAREKSLGEMVEELDSQRATIKGGAVKKIKVVDEKGHTKNIYKWKRIRLR